MLNVEVFIIVKNVLLFIIKNVLFYYTIGTTYITIKNITGYTNIFFKLKFVVNY
jgi:hypothetical protein